jgi:valyl-tRNA synthetase
MNLKPSLKIPLRIKTSDSKKELIANTSAHYVIELARLEDLEIGPSVAKPKVSASSILSGAEVIVPLEGLMDFGEEKKRLEKELKKVEKEIIFLSKKLSNPNFVDRAPPDVIEKDRQKHKDLSEKQTKLQVHLKTIEQALA